MTRNHVLRSGSSRSLDAAAGELADRIQRPTAPVGTDPARTVALFGDGLSAATTAYGPSRDRRIRGNSEAPPAR
jgi:hypothetical protein